MTMNRSVRNSALYSFVGLTVKSLVIDAVLDKIKMCKACLLYTSRCV